VARVKCAFTFSLELPEANDELQSFRCLDDWNRNRALHTGWVVFLVLQLSKLSRDLMGIGLSRLVCNCLETMLGGFVNWFQRVLPKSLRLPFAVVVHVYNLLIVAISANVSFI